MSAADWAFRAHRLSLAKWLMAQGAVVGVVCPPGENRGILKRAGLEVFELEWSREKISIWEAWRAARELRRIAHQFDADVIHCVSIRCILMGWLAGWSWEGRPWRVVNHVIGMGSVYSDTLKTLKGHGMKRLVSMALGRAFRSDATINVFQNEDDLAFWKKRTDLPSTVWAKIPGSITWENHDVSERDSGAFRIIYVGRMLVDKGVGELHQAWRKLIETDPSVELVLCGDVDPGNPNSLTRERMRAWAREPGLHWLGRRSDVIDQMKAAHLVVLPSYREGMPKVILEAGMAGRAVVTTNVPGCREVVNDDETGLLVPARNADALYRAILKLKRNPQLRQRLAKGLHTRVQESFTDDLVHPRWGNLYREVIG